MYLTIIAWVYVVLMMSIAEATSTTGTVLGAVFTFLLYGVLPLSIVVYVMRTPTRRAALKAREAQEAQEAQMAAQAADGAQLHENVQDDLHKLPSAEPDAGGHAPGAAALASIPPVGKKPG